MTADELLAMPDSRWGYELVRGKLKKYMPAGNLRGYIASKIGAFLTIFVEENKLGAVFAAETGFTIFNDPDTVCAPDSAFVGNEKLNKHGISRAFFLTRRIWLSKSFRPMTGKMILKKKFRST